MAGTPESTPESIKRLAGVDVSAHPARVHYEEDFQGVNGGITAREAGVPYKYFYFDYQTSQPDGANAPNIEASSILVMDPAQIEDNHWGTIRVRITHEETYREVNIRASIKAGTKVEIEYFETANHASTTIAMREGTESVHCALVQYGENTVLTRGEEVDPQVSELAIGIFTDLMQRTQQMIDSGFERRTQS